MDNTIIEIVAEWIRFSDMDLEAAKHLYENMNPKPLEIICYHCQQSAEKALKAYLISSGIKPERTHNLNYLIDECRKNDLSFEEIIEQCERLNPYSSQPRYPYEFDISIEIVILALKDCNDINSFIKSKLEYKKD